MREMIHYLCFTPEQLEKNIVSMQKQLEISKKHGKEAKTTGYTTRLESIGSIEAAIEGMKYKD